MDLYRQWATDQAASRAGRAASQHCRCRNQCGCCRQPTATGASALDSVGAWVGMFDLVVVRGLAAPLALYAVLRSQRATSRNDVTPPNLMSWTLAIALVFVAFRFADMLVPVAGTEHSFVAGATAALLLGLLVLATQTGPFSQMVGALRIENAIVLFELGSGHRDLAMQIAQTVILVATVLLFRWYLNTLPRSSALKVSAVEGMNL